MTLQKLSHQNRFTFVIACPVSDGAPRQKPDIVQQRRVFIAQRHSVEDVFGFLRIIGALRLQHCQADCRVPDGPSERHAFLLRALQ